MSNLLPKVVMSPTQPTVPSDDSIANALHVIDHISDVYTTQVGDLFVANPHGS